MKMRTPNHATVVSYLALFVALSAGGAWAADKIGSKEIKRNAVRAKHIKRNQVRAKQLKRNAVRAKHIKRNQVRAKQLKRSEVLSRHIATDQILDRHIPGDTITAGKIVDGPGSGLDADTLDGRSSGDFLGAGRILYGRAASDEDRTLLFEWAAGVEVRTRDVNAGDSPFEVRLINTSDAGGPSFYVSDGSSASLLSPGESEAHGSLLGTSLLLTENNGPQGRMLRLHCFANVIQGGDDGFIQCMGITAPAA